MFSKSMQYSYREQKNQRHKLLKILTVCFVLFLIYNCLISFFFSVWIINNDTMQPGISSKDRIIFSSIKNFSQSNNNRAANEKTYLFSRGSIVLVDMNYNKEQKWPLKAIDAVVRFFTMQKISIFSGGPRQYYIKRVIALPGDEISMNNFVFRVKTKNSQYSFTEFELAERPYHPSIPQMPGLWDESLPFSGNMDPVIMGEDECFVISDDRSNTNDSRTWGPIPPSKITARAVLRIWPLNKIQLL